jgi:phosphonate transport system substrate-binding protein
VESISDRTRLISRAIYEQKIGANQIWSSVEKIKDLPVENRAIAFRINRSLQRLLKDAELVTSELDRFKLHERRGERVFRMGVVPFAPPALMYRKFLPLADYLSRRTGFRIELRVASDFASAVEEITHGVTHLCYMTTLTYIKARKAGSVELLAMSLREGKPHHHSVIVTAASREIASVRELKGRSFAFVDPNSFSGYRMPKAMLGEEGVKLADLSYHNFVGYHDDVVRVVLRGDYDAGGVMEAAALKHKDEGLRILKTSPEIPEFNIAVSRSLAREEADALKAAIMSLNEGSDEARAVLESISPHTTGFTAATDADFDPVREILTEEDEQ